MQTVNDFSTIAELNEQFTQLKTQLFTGILLLEVQGSPTWKLYFRLGRISWQSGGINPWQKWQRYIKYFGSNLKPEVMTQFLELKNSTAQYEALPILHDKKLMSQTQIKQLINNIIVESLFDTVLNSYHQKTPIIYKTISNEYLDTIIHLMDSTKIMSEFKLMFQKWIGANLQEYSPNYYPVIEKPELIIQDQNINILGNTLSLIDGTSDLYTLAWKTKKNIVEITESLTPLVKNGAISFHSVKTPCKPIKLINNSSSHKSKTLIACVDDSPLICQNLENIITEAGYRFLGVQESLKAVPILLKNKPDLIFLDLIMPVINGYELCSHLRKVPTFKDTPIIILTGKDGLVDRMRAKMIGSSDFLSKPIVKELVIEIINKYILVKEIKHD